MKLRCVEVAAVEGWDGAVAHRARFSLFSPNTPSPAGMGDVWFPCEVRQFVVGKDYYLTFRTAEEIVDAKEAP